jgi:uncharacterized protein (DUF4213/DUF364 family)
MQSPPIDPTGSIASEIVNLLQARAQPIKVADVRIGLGYTAVLLEDRRAGVAYTFRQEAKGGCSVFHSLRPISGRPASDLLQLLESTDPIEAAVGLACANALGDPHDERFVEGDLLDHLDLRPDDAVGMVGHFKPLVEPLNERAGALTVFERIREPQGYLRPVPEVAETLPNCQVALITGTSIINHTIDSLLDAAKHCREVVILGASTPLLPEAFAGRNVTMLAGVVVDKPADTLRVVSEGGGMSLFKPYIRKVSLPIAQM